MWQRQAQAQQQLMPRQHQRISPAPVSNITILDHPRASRPMSIFERVGGNGKKRPGIYVEPAIPVFEPPSRRLGLGFSQKGKKRG